MNKKNLFLIVLISYMIGCTPYVAPKPESGPSAKVYQEPEPVVSEPKKDVPMTFLDSLNRGKEIGLNENEFKSAETKSGNSTPTNIQSSSGARFRIQIFASSQIERLREDKKKIEKQLDLPMSIAFEAPYYKLLAGDFLQRADAEAALQKVKKLGFQDAWVVTTRALPGE